jgi:hypothetical protein
MAATPLLGLELPVTGTLSGTWGDAVNNQITSLIDFAVAGTTVFSTDQNETLTTTASAANTARSAIIRLTGSRASQKNVIAPASSKIYVVINATTGSTTRFCAPGPTTGVILETGEEAVLAWNGTDFIRIANLGGPGAFTTLTATDGSGISALNATNLTSGTVPNARFPATLPAASGENLTSLPAGNLTGAVPATTLATALNVSGSAPLYVARAWVNFNGTGTPAIRASGNVGSITDNGTGDYTVNFTTALPDANYAPAGLMATLSGNEIRAIAGGATYAQTASSLRVQTWSSTALGDAAFVTIAIFR